MNRTTDSETAAAPPRWLELLLWVGFAALIMIAVMTVAWPELRQDKTPQTKSAGSVTPQIPK